MKEQPVFVVYAQGFQPAVYTQRLFVWRRIALIAGQKTIKDYDKLRRDDVVIMSEQSDDLENLKTATYPLLTKALRTCKKARLYVPDKSGGDGVVIKVFEFALNEGMSATTAKTKEKARV